MFKALAVCGLIALSSTMRLESEIDHLNHSDDRKQNVTQGSDSKTESSGPVKLSDSQKKWDEFYRNQIKALGDA